MTKPELFALFDIKQNVVRLMWTKIKDYGTNKNALKQLGNDFIDCYSCYEVVWFGLLSAIFLCKIHEVKFNFRGRN